MDQFLLDGAVCIVQLSLIGKNCVSIKYDLYIISVLILSSGENCHAVIESIDHE